jgi:molybdopterin molybdotransferase
MSGSETTSPQRIPRLTPLGDILAAIDKGVGMVEPRRCPVAQALGRILAADVVAPLAPPSAIALRDGFAVEAAAIADAGSYAPAQFASAPPRVDVGDPLPRGTDAVLPLDAVTLRSDRAEAIASVAPGDGVLPAGADVSSRTPLRRAGERLRALDLAVMESANIAHVMVREPRVRIACGSAAKTPIIGAALAMLADAVVAAGGNALEARGEGAPIDAALADDGADAVFAIGGTGSGRHDSSVRALARLGRVMAHGIGVSPGETAAFGFAGARPVLLIPGRLDAVLSIWLVIGRYLTAKLAGGSVEDRQTMLPLKRKVASAIGLTELVPVVCSNGVADPLASGYLSFEALARSDGFIVIAADSEGFAAGTPVTVRSWP